MCAYFCKDVRIEESHLARIISTFTQRKWYLQESAFQKMAVASVMILLELLITSLPLVLEHTSDLSLDWPISWLVAQAMSVLLLLHLDLFSVQRMISYHTSHSESFLQLKILISTTLILADICVVQGDSESLPTGTLRLCPG